MSTKSKTTTKSAAPSKKAASKKPAAKSATKKPAPKKNDAAAMADAALSKGPGPKKTSPKKSDAPASSPVVKWAAGNYEVLMPGKKKADGFRCIGITDHNGILTTYGADSKALFRHLDSGKVFTRGGEEKEVDASKITRDLPATEQPQQPQPPAPTPAPAPAPAPAPTPATGYAIGSLVVMDGTTIRKVLRGLDPADNTYIIQGDGTPWLIAADRLTPAPTPATPKKKRYESKTPTDSNYHNCIRSTCEKPIEVVRRICAQMAGQQRKNVLAACVAAGVNPSTAATQYSLWKVANK